MNGVLSSWRQIYTYVSTTNGERTTIRTGEKRKKGFSIADGTVRHDGLEQEVERPGEWHIQEDLLPKQRNDK